MRLQSIKDRVTQLLFSLKSLVSLPKAYVHLYCRHKFEFARSFKINALIMIDSDFRESGPSLTSDVGLKINKTFDSMNITLNVA